jgi:hypothetical protein
MKIRRYLIAAAAVVALVVGGAVAANASTLGTIAAGIFGGNGSATYPSATRSVTAVALTTSGTTVTGLTMTITGSSLSTLDGQTATISLQNSSGSQVQGVTSTLVTGTNLTVGTSTATATLSVPGAPAAASISVWSAFIGGTQTVGGTADASQRNLVLGHGTVTVTSSGPAWVSAVVPPSGENAATNITAVTPSQTSATGACLTMTVTGTTATPQAWQFTVDYSQPPYYGTAPSLDHQTKLASQTGTVLTLVGKGSFQKVSNTQTLDILVCSYSGVVPQDEPSAYSVAAQVQGATWTSTKACVDRTVTGNGTLPFYFGWSTSFDMTAAINLVKTSDAGAPRVFVYHADPTTPATYTPGTTTYAMTSGPGDPISGSGTFVAELCVSEY